MLEKQVANFSRQVLELHWMKFPRLGLPDCTQLPDPHGAPLGQHVRVLPETHDV